MEAVAASHTSVSTQEIPNSKQNVQDYYTEAGPDYKIWSKDFNMHFGLAINPLDCWSRETMLKQMNTYVFKKMQLADKEQGTIYDMGCGLSAPLRQGARMFPALNFVGVTLVNWQVIEGEKFLKEEGIKNAIVENTDYVNTPFESNTADGIYFIESLCHADGLDKAAPLRESYRLLKAKQKLIIADGMTKVEPKYFGSFLFKIYRLVCDNWALSDMANIYAIVARLKQIGYKDISYEEVSWKIAPSAVQSPFITVWFLIKKLFKGEAITRQGIRNLKACFSIFFLGLFRKQIGYFIISARK
jgi:MPBQ/MSBQ methyltransferase